ncbi:Pycsar system effector family protein [Streptomyces sp. NRRL B-24484]|uniref:Pycsar system effector family protein n=1 Tax=Streptomyces sp. NRRL B-24484 TaxID=1463833 RepID=UPI0004C1D1F9|nr:Pycsar system effector family protein [Streptomyces sp. NRRL B-24484]
MSTTDPGPNASETMLAYTASHGLDIELAAVTADIARTDSKSSLILTLSTLMVGGIALLGKMPPVALGVAAVGTTAMIGSAALSILVVMPRTDKTRSTGFTRWADLRPEEIPNAVTADPRPQRLHNLSKICEGKMTHLVWASRLSLLAIIATSAAAILTGAS